MVEGNLPQTATSHASFLFPYSFYLPKYPTKRALLTRHQAATLLLLNTLKYARPVLICYLHFGSGADGSPLICGPRVVHMVWNASEQVCTRRGTSWLPLPLSCMGALPARHSLGSTRCGQRPGSLSRTRARSPQHQMRGRPTNRRADTTVRLPA